MTSRQTVGHRKDSNRKTLILENSSVRAKDGGTEPLALSKKSQYHELSNAMSTLSGDREEEEEKKMKMKKLKNKKQTNKKNENKKGGKKKRKKKKKKKRERKKHAWYNPRCLLRTYCHLSSKEKQLDDNFLRTFA